MTWLPHVRSSQTPSCSFLVSSDEGCFISGSELSSTLKKIVEGVRAGEVLRVMSPVIDDPRVVLWLRSARQRGAVVRVLTTLVDRHGIRTKGWDASENIESHGESIRELAKCGCTLRSTRTTPHAKFVLGNHSNLWFGSANLTVGALEGHTIEAALILDNLRVFRQIQTIFDQYWKSTPYSLVHRQGAISIEEKSNLETALVENELSEEGLSVWSSAPRVSMATCGVNRLLGLATDHIILVAMSLYELEKVPEMQEILLTKLESGVRVQAIVRKEHFAHDELKGRYPDSATRNLLKSGMELLGCKGLHAKGFVVDDRWCGIQSANFNPYSFDWQRDECNVELFIVGDTKDQDLIAFADWMRSLPTKATHTFKIRT